LITEEKRIIVGRINGLYGVHGWVKVFSYTSPITNILNYSPWQLCQQGQWQTLSICEKKAHGKGIIARFESIHDRDEAARLLDVDIAIWQSQLSPAAEGEYYWTDLMGLTVINRDNVTLGQVEHLLETGVHDILVVKGERERLIPFVFEHIIFEVDLTQRVIRVDWDADF
jgi:16S rRNA processing protein RimM